MKKKSFVAAVYAFVMLSTQASGFEYGDPAPPPGGYFDFCRAGEEHCPYVEKREIYYSGILQAHLDKAARIARFVEYEAESNLNVWRTDCKVGDCEDRAFCAKQFLIKTGYPPGAIRYIRGTDLQNQSHLWLAVNVRFGNESRLIYVDHTGAKFAEDWPYRAQYVESYDYISPDYGYYWRSMQIIEIQIASDGVERE